MHFLHDVRAADEFTMDIKLGDCRPIAIELDALPNGLPLQDVDGVDHFRISPCRFQQLDGATRKPHIGNEALPFMNRTMG